MGLSLKKGDRISLAKEAGPTLASAVMGLGWDQKSGGGGFFGMFSSGGTPIDLDASCLLLDATLAQVDAVSFRQLVSRDGSLRHSGDNRTGEGAGDDEKIAVDLTRVLPNVHHLVFTINSYGGQPFSAVKNAYCRLVNQTTNAEIARYDLSGGGTHSALIMSRLYREGTDWKMHAIGEPAAGRTATDLLPRVRELLST